MRILPILFLLSCIISSPAKATETAGVVVSIKPLHSLVAGVMEGTGTPELIVSGDVSPHEFSLKPSQMKKLQEANVIFYIDPAFETFLHNALESLPVHIRKAAVAQKAGLTILSHRKGGAWEAHEYHAHEHKVEHQHHEHEGEHGDEHESEHDHGHEDLHVWLDADNAKKIVTSIATELALIYPDNKPIYEKNAQATIKRITALDEKIKKEMAGLGNKPFIVFHDAYQYFERRYGLSAVGSATFEPEELPSTTRITQVRKKIKDTDAVCIFKEPFFSDKLIKTISEGSSARTGTLDPEGTGIQAGKDLYFILMENLAKSIKDCLTT